MINNIYIYTYRQTYVDRCMYIYIYVLTYRCIYIYICGEDITIFSDYKYVKQSLNTGMEIHGIHFDKLGW